MSRFAKLSADDKKSYYKKIYYISCIMVFTIGLLASFLTLAYFTSKDEVTNVHAGSDVSISIVEDKWVDHGLQEALKSQPGMQIDKDPAVRNTSKDHDVYIRMRFNITDKNGNVLDKTSEKYKAILSALMINSDGLETNFVETDTDTHGVIQYTNNPNFVYVPAGTSITIDGTDISGSDTEDWYYYYDQDETKKAAASKITLEFSKFKSLAIGELSPTLFDRIDLPIFKANQVNSSGSIVSYGYIGHFDEPYIIEIEAQAVNVDFGMDFIERFRYEDSVTNK